MANLTYNRIDDEISETTINSIKTSLKQISSLLPNHALTDDERKSFRGINVDNRIFIEHCIIELRTNGAETMPSYIKTDNLISDF